MCTLQLHTSRAADVLQVRRVFQLFVLLCFTSSIRLSVLKLICVPGKAELCGVPLANLVSNRYYAAEDIHSESVCLLQPNKTMYLSVGLLSTG